jgi:hypothetical protein
MLRESGTFIEKSYSEADLQSSYRRGLPEFCPDYCWITHNPETSGAADRQW